MDSKSKHYGLAVGALSMVAVVSVCLALQFNKKSNRALAGSTQPVIPSNEFLKTGKILILYGTTTGTGKAFAFKLLSKLSAAGRTVETCSMSDYDQEKLVKEDIVLVICSTWEGGVAPESCRAFMEDLKDYAFDFRVSKNLLEKLHFAVFGLGGELYGPNFGKAAVDIDEMLRLLGGNGIADVMLGDDASNLEERFGRWTSQMMSALTSQDPSSAVLEDETVSKRQQKKAKRSQELSQKKLAEAQAKAESNQPTKATHSKTNKKAVVVSASDSSCCKTDTSAGKSSGSCCGGSSAAKTETKQSSGCGCNETVDSNTLGLDPAYDSEEEEEDIINNNYVTMDHVEDAAEEAHQKEMAGLLDLEDMGASINQSSAASLQHRQAVKDSLRETGAVAADGQPVERREMVTKLQRKALTKEGYKIIGTHSAVKICRWTKNQLRGRGGCYKHSFYGITSYQCMEATPSLACANKCVFCWRHHKNPVGTEWRWKEDSPSLIVSEAVRLHQGMINEMRGVPGVQTERLQEAFSVKHCALSLVGEPIMYPRINEMLAELHNREISSFMVTNAQFPEHIRSLDPVTQLYVSVDASTRDSLKAIDRPLFKDFWERFLSSLEELKRKQQRTVYRMTLVKSWNMDQAEGYAELIESGQPDFIEIKAMTYCGKSDASSLTMQNVPWHTEVCAYGDALCERLAQRGVLPFRYNIATEHEHSCCILLAREDKFRPNGEWHTWIDYDKFHDLMRRYYASNGQQTFKSEDYIAATPPWALYKSATRGFDPEEQRWHRNKTTGALVEIPYEASESGCG